MIALNVAYSEPLHFPAERLCSRSLGFASSPEARMSYSRRIRATEGRRSIRIGRDDLTERPRGHGSPRDGIDRGLEEVDRAVGEEHVRPAGMHAPVVLDVGQGIVDGAWAVLEAGRPHDLRPALLGRGVEPVGTSLDRRRLAE